MNKLCITVLSAAIAAMPLGASEAMSYNELDITVDSYWDTTGRTGVAVETDSCACMKLSHDNLVKLGGSF